MHANPQRVDALLFQRKICTYTVHVHIIVYKEKMMAATAIARIVVQATPQEKKAISAKAKKYGFAGI